MWTVDVCMSLNSICIPARCIADEIVGHGAHSRFADCVRSCSLTWQVPYKLQSDQPWNLVPLDRSLMISSPLCPRALADSALNRTCQELQSPGVG